MALFASNETISRIVETYSPMLLRLACTRLDVLRRRGGRRSGGVFEAAHDASCVPKQ